MKAPLRKVFIARYILYLEVIGFVIMGAIIAGMIFCVIFRMDDVNKVKSDTVTARIEPVTLAAKSWIDKVLARDGESVVKGQPLLVVHDDPRDAQVLEARFYLESAYDTLSSPTLSVDGASRLVQAVEQARDALRNVNLSGRPKTIAAPVEGILKGAGLDGLPGTIKKGQVCEIHNFDSLRFAVAVTGKNAERVNINLLGVPDVEDWRALTRAVRSEQAPEDARVRRVWELLTDEENKKALRFIRPGKTPDDTGKADVIKALNGVLRRTDFYSAKIWPASTLGLEAQRLVAKGVPQLTESELFRLNRLLFESAFPQLVRPSKNERQKIKAKIIIPQESQLVNGKEKKLNPIIYQMDGEVISDKDTSDKVLVDLPKPEDALVEHLKKRLANPDSATAPTMTGSIVVGRIPVFMFLFSKQ